MPRAWYLLGFAGICRCFEESKSAQGPFIYNFYVLNSCPQAQHGRNRAEVRAKKLPKHAQETHI